MESKEFTDNLLRVIAAEMHLSNLLRSSVEICGKSLWELSAPELKSLQDKVTGFVGALYNVLTPGYLSSPGNKGDLPFGNLPPTVVQ